jgi:hypothetical protein
MLQTILLAKWWRRQDIFHFKGKSKSNLKTVPYRLIYDETNSN